MKKIFFAGLLILFTGCNQDDLSASILPIKEFTPSIYAYLVDGSKLDLTDHINTLTQGEKINLDNYEISAQLVLMDENSHIQQILPFPNLPSKVRIKNYEQKKQFYESQQKRMLNKVNNLDNTEENKAENNTENTVENKENKIDFLDDNKIIEKNDDLLTTETTENNAINNEKENVNEINTVNSTNEEITENNLTETNSENNLIEEIIEDKANEEVLNLPNEIIPISNESEITPKVIENNNLSEEISPITLP